MNREACSVVDFGVTMRALLVLWIGLLVLLSSPSSAHASEGSVAAPVANLARLRTQSSAEALNSRLKAAQATEPAKFWTDDFDLAAALKSTAQGGDPEAERVLQDTLAALGALAAVGTPEAVLEMTKVSNDHGGLLRVEVGRRLKAMGDHATAGLLLAQREPSIRHFASATLEAMGKRVAGDAVQTKDDGVLVDVLTAFGTLRDPNALGVVLSFLSADRDKVRAAARAATVAYGKDAAPKLRDIYTNIEGRPPPAEWEVTRLSTELFAALDADRLAELYALVDEGLKEERDGKLDLAAASFDKALARQPNLERRREMVPTYMALARALEDTDRDRASATYRRAQSLDPGGAHQGQIDGALAYLEGEDLRAKGIVDREPFDRALLADPGNEKARAALEGMDGDRRAREERAQHWLWATIAGAGVLALLILFVGRGRRKAAA